MEGLISIVFLAATTISYIIVAGIASRGVSTKDGYLLGDRQFSVKSITLTMIATQLGAGMFFGTAAEAYNKGLLGIAYVLGMAIGLLILGLGVGSRLRALNISTTAELFEKKYGSRALRRLAAFISILTMGGILAAQIVASRQLFANLFDISPLWLVIFWLAVIAYTTFGGLKAIIATDIFQVILIVVIFTSILFYIIPVSEIGSLLSQKPVLTEPIFNGNFFSILLGPILFSIIEQDLAQRCFAAKTQKVATISSLLAALFLLVYSLVPIIFGMYAKSIGIVFKAGQSPLVLLFETKLSTIGMTLVACALLAAICSTADSLLGAASTNLIADFLPKKAKFSLMTSRLLTLLVGLSALLIAFNFDDVIQIIIKSYEISICALFIPIVLAIYRPKPSRLGAKLSVGFGITAFFVANSLENSMPPTLLALMISGIAFLAGSMWEKQTHKSK
jgi:SSS family solute:Na+ symporter